MLSLSSIILFFFTFGILCVYLLNQLFQKKQIQNAKKEAEEIIHQIKYQIEKQKEEKTLMLNEQQWDLKEKYENDKKTIADHKYQINQEFREKFEPSQKNSMQKINLLKEDLKEKKIFI